MRALAMSVGVALLIASGVATAQDSSGADREPETAPPALEEEARRLVLDLAAGEYSRVEGRFDATMRQALPEAKLKATWEQVQGQAGAFQEVERTRLEKIQIYDVVLVTCRFESRRLDVKLVFNGKREISGLFFTPPGPAAEAARPPYARPDRYREVETTVGAPGWPLEGTLTLPVTEGPHPGLVLVHGSGPLDRDESVGAGRPFRDLAWGLASRGVAVLRYEKRTLAHGPRLVAETPRLTVKEETVDDALAAVKALASRDGIDRSRIFVAGHSLGAMLVPRMAGSGEAIAGFVLMAAPARPIPDLALIQARYIAELDGGISESEAEQIGRMEEAVAAVKALESGGQGNGESILGAPPSYWLDLKGYRPHLAAREIDRPMLVLLGERDYQVTRQDFDLWKEALGSRDDVSFRLFPELNHLFIRGSGRPGPAEYGTPGFVALEVIEEIAGWILAQSGD